MPDFIAPQLCASVERPPPATDWVHEIKFDGYRMQMRVEDGEATLKTRKGLDWTDKFPADREGSASWPDAHHRRRDRRARRATAHPDFAALQAALSDGKTDDLIFFAFDLLFDEGEDLRAAAAARAQGAAEATAGKRRKRQGRR